MAELLPGSSGPRGLEPSTCAGPEEYYDATWREYRDRAVARALALKNRGPVRLDPDGKLLAKEILEAYHLHGFYVFENVISEEEVAELRAEFDSALENAPAKKGVTTDRHGRPVKFPGYYSLAEAPAGEPPVVGVIAHPLMVMESALRVYGHPQICRIVESIQGPDFVPGASEVILHKPAGVGLPTNWHQDGRTHWTKEGLALEQPDGTGKRHGFNLSVSWSNCTAEQCLWVVPGSQWSWRLANGGSFPPISERIPEAVPATLNPGDLCAVNRSTLHGSFPNRSAERRVTMVLGFHNRASALGTETTNVHAFMLPTNIQEKRVKYTEEYVLKRARMIPLAIDARRQQFPHEIPYEYKGSYLGGGEWNEQARAEISKEGDEYWQRNITL